MFFRKRTGNVESVKEAPDAAPAPVGAAVEIADGEAAHSQPPSGEVASRNPHLALGQIVSLMARSPQFRQAKLADLRWLVVPAIRSSQVAVAEARDAAGHASPVAAVLWARVSDEVDLRLTDSPTLPPQLKKEDWSSGEIPWVVVAVGAEKACGATIAQISRTVFDGRNMKMSVRGGDGKVAVRSLTVAA